MLTLSVKNRDTKETAEDLRADGMLPAVFYGRSTDSTPVQVPVPEFLKLWHKTGGSTVFEIKRGNGETKTALIQDVSLHPVTGEPLHADFYIIEEGQTVNVDLPLEFVGTAPAVKNLGGLLVHVLHSVEVEADPTKLPDHVEVDVSSLEEIGSQATVSDITVPEGVEILAEEDEVVALVEEPEELEELEPEEEAEEFDFDDIEVEGERPTEEEGEMEGEEIPGEEGGTEETPTEGEEPGQQFEGQ